MRKSATRSVIALAVLAGLLALTCWPPRPPVELRVVNTKSVGRLAGTEYRQFTLSICNRTTEEITFSPIGDIQVRIAGRWTVIDQVFEFQSLRAGQASQKRVHLQADADRCRLSFHSKLRYSPTTWMSRVLSKLGPQAVQLVSKSRWLSNWVWPGEHPADAERTLEVALPASRASTDDSSP